MERRYIGTPISLAGEGETPKKITGYAAMFNRMSVPLPTRSGTFRERILPGAFNPEGDVLARYNHDILLGRSTSGTLKLSVDETGLRYEITPSDSALTQHVVQAIRRGDVRGSSFAFEVVPGGESWKVENGERVRELRSVVLRDVGPVDMPAYPDTAGDGVSVAMRSEDVIAEMPEPDAVDVKPLKPRYD